MAKSDPKDVTIKDGLAKMREAADKLTEEEVDALAEGARQAAIDAKKEIDDKKR